MPVCEALKTACFKGSENRRRWSQPQQKPKRNDNLAEKNDSGGNIDVNVFDVNVFDVNDTGVTKYYDSSKAGKTHIESREFRLDSGELLLRISANTDMLPHGACDQLQETELTREEHRVSSITMV